MDRSTRRRRSVALLIACVVVAVTALTAILTGVFDEPGTSDSAAPTAGNTAGTARPDGTPPGTSAPSTPAPSTPAPSTPAPSSGPAPTLPPAAGTVDAPACRATGRQVERIVLPAGVGTQWAQETPADDVTYDLTGVTSTAYPATESVFAVGIEDAPARTCVIGGTVLGEADDDETWNYYHDEYNAACIKIIAVEWMQVHGLRCDNVEDGIKPQESGVNANNARFFVSGTHLTRIRDDCMENDYTVGGVLYDNLWEECNTGISERPSGDRQWSTPASETLVLDHMLIGLYETPHDEDGETVMGENALFKWSESGNRVVIKCSVFKVDSVSLNGESAMALPPGTVVDDSACPDDPSTIVWLGGGTYPAWAAGLRVVDDESVWTRAVDAWLAAHQ